MTASTEERQDALAKLRKWALERDDSGPYRVYRDKDGNIYYSVTTILQHTAPQRQKDALKKWSNRPGSELQRELACSRGTMTHEHCEYVLKTASKLARRSANSRNSWKIYEDGLARNPKAITTWALKKAIEGAPEVSWTYRAYTRNLAPFLESIAAIHASEFSVSHSGGWAGTADALIDYGKKTGVLTICDFKTSGSAKDKPEEFLQDHLDQLGAYSEALFEMIGIRPRRGVLAVVRENGLQIREVSELEILGATVRFRERAEKFKEMVLNGEV